MVMKKQKLLLFLRGCFVVCFLAVVNFAFARGIDKYLKNHRQFVRDVKFIPITLQDGMESQRTPLWPLKNRSKIFWQSSYLKNEEYAKRAGIDLKKDMDKYFSAGYKDGFFFLLFYNFLTAPVCQSDYVIQKVKLKKLYYDFSGNLYEEREQFLVEVLKLNAQKETVRSDEHRRVYSLGKAFKRKIIVDLDAGCGEILYEVEGRAWPFAENRLQHRVQSYSDNPGLYDEVDFDFSSHYRVIMEFDRDGKFSVDLPNISQ